MEISILLFTFAPVMLGQASAIKVRNQVSEYPPLSKLAGCFCVPRYWLQRYKIFRYNYCTIGKNLITVSYFSDCGSHFDHRGEDCNATFRNLVAKNPVPCRVDGLLGDAHDAAHVPVFHAHFVEDEEEGILCKPSDQRSSGERSQTDIVYYLLNNERRIRKQSTRDHCLHYPHP